MYYFVFDVESIGLYGEGFAVAGGLYNESGKAIDEFCFSCNQSECDGLIVNREWVSNNVPFINKTHNQPHEIRSAFWEKLVDAKNKNALIAAECAYPVESGFLISCINDAPERLGQSPYPLHEISSFMLAAGLDPMANYERIYGEHPKHHPLHDARQSVRLLISSIKIINNRGLSEKIANNL